jgi:hypothetical protein
MRMNRRTAVAALLSPAIAAGMPRPASVQSLAASWTPLFNGRDLAGWETFLGRPHKTTEMPGLPRNDDGEYLAPVGVNRDPRGVFSAVQIDGEPAVRVSGEIYGGLITLGEFENYHLRFQFKWGEKRWPPRVEAVRDSGCCYHSVGPHGASYGFWMQSLEFQIQEGDCGDFYSLAGVIVDVEGVPAKPDDPRSELIYKRGAPRVSGYTRRIIREPFSEKPYGEWNTLELYCHGQNSVHVVNGTPNMAVSGARRPLEGRVVPLTKGRIQFQSEAAEVFYRRIEIRAIDRIARPIAI